MEKETNPRRGAKSCACDSADHLRAKHFDKYYTNPAVARLCVDLMQPFLGPYTLLIEPSAGGGAFLAQTDRDIIGFDIAPDNDNVIERDFLALPAARQHDVAFIGNPPFGPNGSLAIEFINHALAIGGTVGFIVPITFRKWMRQTKLNPAARLVLDQKIPAQSFTKCGEPYEVRCVFQVWTTEGDAPDLRLTKMPPSAHPDFEMIRIGTGQNARARAHSAKWDFAVPRTGGYDFTAKVWSADELRPACEYILIAASSPEVLKRLLSIDYVGLSLLSARRPYLTQSDIVEGYSEALMAEQAATLGAQSPSILSAIHATKPVKTRTKVAANDQADVEPKKASIRSRDRTFEVFRTPASTFTPLLDYRPDWFEGRGFDPSAGDGRMIREIIDRGNAGPHFLNEIRDEEQDVLAAIPRATVTIGDYLAMADPPECDFMITNPPFSCAQAIVEKALTHTKGPVCIIQTVQWQSTRKRSEWLTRSGLSHVLNLTRRPKWEVGEGVEPPKMLWDFAWFVFMPGFEGRPSMDWIDLPQLAA